MSYILDALKKSDQERQQNNGPTLQTIQHHGQPEQKSSALTWLLLLILLALLLVAGAGLGYYWLWGEKPSNVMVEPVPPANTSVPEAPLLPQPADQPIVAIPEPAPVVKPKPDIVELWELPDNVQQQIPPMTFSFHVFSDNPERRTIIINNRRVKQGDTVVAGLVLEAITERGVVFDWQGDYRFSINVVENW